MEKKVLKKDYLILNFINIIVLVIAFFIYRNELDTSIDLNKNLDDYAAMLGGIYLYIILIMIGIKILQGIVIKLYNNEKQWFNIAFFIFEVIFFIGANYFYFNYFNTFILQKNIVNLLMNIFDIINFVLILLDLLRINNLNKEKLKLIRI